MTNIDKALGYLKQYSEETSSVYDLILDELSDRAGEIGKLPSDVVTKFNDLARGGKRLRGSLVKLGYELANGAQNPDILKAGLIQELVHSAILVDDDIMDNAKLRRGVPTIHASFNSDIAICLSDSVYFYAFEKLLDLNFPTKELREASKYYTDSISNLGFGQMLDIDNSGNPSSEDEIMNVLWLKSGEYSVHTPLKFGALLAGNQDDSFFVNLEAYSKTLGWAFQISDDLLGSFGDPAKTGKPNDSDIREAKNTLLVLHVRKHGTSEQQQILEKYLGKSDLTNLENDEVKQVFIDSGAKTELERKCKELVSEGTGYVSDLTEDSEHASVLTGLLDFMLVRES